MADNSIPTSDQSNGRAQQQEPPDLWVGNRFELPSFLASTPVEAVTAQTSNPSDSWHRELQAERFGTPQVSDRTAGAPLATRVAQNDWHTDLANATVGLEALRHLDAGRLAPGQVNRAELINQVDRHFQSAVTRMGSQVEAADMELLGRIFQAQNLDQKLTVLQRDPAVQRALGDVSKGLTMDMVQNAVMNESDPATRNKLVQLGADLEMAALSKQSFDASAQALNANKMARYEYADFLLTYKNGFSATPDGKQFGALDVMAAIPQAELYASPQGQELLRKSQESQTQNQAQVIAPEKNPYYFMAAAQQAQDPAQRLALGQQGLEMAQKLDIPSLQKQLNELKTKGNDAETQQKIAALTDLIHSPAVMEGYLGQFLLQQNPPKADEAIKHLMAAAGDPFAADRIVSPQDGHPILNELFQAATAIKHPDMGKDLESFKSAMEAVDKANKAAQEMLKAGSDNFGARMKMTEAITHGKEAIAAAERLKQAFGPNADELVKDAYKILAKPENERTAEEKSMLTQLQPLAQVVDFKAMAQSAVASMYLFKQDFHAAKQMVDQITKDNPNWANDTTHKAQFDAWNEAIERGINGPTMWQWMKENSKLVALYTACVVGTIAGATAIALSGGTATPLVVGAWTIGSGFLAGTAAGGYANYKGGHSESFLGGCTNVAGYALAGSVLAYGGQAFAPELGAVSQATGFFGRMAATAKLVPAAMKGGAIIGTAAGAAWNTQDVANGFREGKYSGDWKGVKDAAIDWGTGEAAWIVGGAATGPLMLAPGAAATRFGAAYPTGTMMGNMGRGVGLIATSTTTPMMLDFPLLGANDLSGKLTQAEIAYMGYRPQWFVNGVLQNREWLYR